jgi:hypothetical protein
MFSHQRTIVAARLVPPLIAGYVLKFEKATTTAILGRIL